MDDYRQYLAQKILTEDQVVTYRLLSRALKVHVNTAKEMLYDFHKWQNDKRPGTMHATYIVYGTKSVPHQEDEDVEMTDSQMSDDVHSAYSDHVPTLTMSLVTEEKLQETLALYSEVNSIHVYSLAPHPLKDLQLLADAAKQVLELSSADSTPNPSKVYGTIANPNVRRRERRPGPPPAARAPTPKQESKPIVKPEAKSAASATIKEESKKSDSRSSWKAVPTKKPTPATSLKRQGSSGISEMFAKQAAKPKKPAAAKPSTPPAANETASTGALSDDGEDDSEPMPAIKKEEEDGSVRQARQQRKAELQRMMEESDEEEESAEKDDESEAEQEEDMMDEDQEEEPAPESKPEPEPEPEPAEVVSSTSSGRRRGKRRVTRKKQIMDEKGYLVTIQEQGWESFSEDEAPAPPPKAKPQQQPVKTEAATKGKKGASKGGQGNIMSFFSKK